MIDDVKALGSKLREVRGEIEDTLVRWEHSDHTKLALLDLLTRCEDNLYNSIQLTNEIINQLENNCD